MTADETIIRELPRALESYPPLSGSLWQTLVDRVQIEPFNLVATGIFAMAILHTFATARFAALAHDVQHQHDARADRDGVPRKPSVVAELLHFVGEVEVVFGLWAGVLLAAIAVFIGWDTARHYLDDTVNFTEPLFVVVIMALASTRPIVTFSEAMLRRVASLRGCTPAAWWFTILTVGPVLGSFITEPAAMTICALLLQRQFFDLEPGMRLKYATLGLLFVNVSIGGTLTHFAAPPVLMVARPWGWDTAFMVSHFGWRAVISILVSTSAYFLLFRSGLTALRSRSAVPDIEVPEEDGADALLPVPWWLTMVHVLFMGWTVLNSHYPVLFVGGFLFFLGFVRATAAYQSRVELRTPLLVGFFLGGLVIHGGLQGWWIAPILGSLTETPLFFGSGLMTAFNDNALITYLATLVPDMREALQVAVVEGAVVGGGLTVIANAPNPAGQALLARFFGGSISPLGLLAGALVPTLVATAAFRVF
ncbi:MAG: putative Na+/H+ antiporter [Vicinamibacterales bacterium]